MPPVILGDETRITVATTTGDIVVVFPPLDDDQFQAAIADLLQHRYKFGGRSGARSDATKERIKFFDRTAVDVENLHYREAGEVKPLTRGVHGWKKRIPPHFKVSAAMRFEEQETLSDEEIEDLPAASGTDSD